MSRLLTSLAAALLLLPAASSCKNKALKKTEDPRLADIRLPAGFHISIYADNVENARSLCLGAKGTVFVGNRQGDKVFALRDDDGDGAAEKRFTVDSGLHMPNGVAFKDGYLYVAEVDKIWRYAAVEDQLSAPPAKELYFEGLPTDEHHGWKYIAFGPDGYLYVPVGAPCNICDDAQRDERYASICRISPARQLEVFAHGIRNSVGFDWHPATRQLWFTENGRDQLGDDVPPDELNTAPQAGLHFGYPYCHAGDIPDPDFGKGKSCADYTAPVAKLAPHTAALGMKFYTGSMFPAAYKNSIIIAEHGSWNRSTPIGYRLMMVSFANGAPKYAPFAEGWLKNEEAWGRPVDVLQLPDGSLLVSDDFANVVYRITYSG